MNKYWLSLSHPKELNKVLKENKMELHKSKISISITGKNGSRLSPKRLEIANGIARRISGIYKLP